MSGTGIAFLAVVAVIAVSLGVHAFVRWRRVNRAGLALEPGSVVTHPVYGGWTPGIPGQAAHLYTGEGAEGLNSFGHGSPGE